MNILDAAYHLAHDYPGGAEALALRMGKQAGRLSHELTATGTAKLGLVDALKMSQLTGDYRVVHAFAAACGGMFVPLPQPDEVVTEALADVATCVKEFGELVTAFCTAVADGKVSRNELRRIEVEAGDALNAIHQLLATATRLQTQMERRS